MSLRFWNTKDIGLSSFQQELNPLLFWICNQEADKGRFAICIVYIIDADCKSAFIYLSDL